jgi:superoxide dismutase, Fe-Mn family
MTFELPSLPFAPDALEPVISANTLSFHHGKHHMAYVNNLNNLIKDTKFAENYSLEEIINEANGPVFNNAAQVWNHTFFWDSLTGEKLAPNEKVISAINKSFESFERFKELFSEASVKLFGSGWTWLVQDIEGKLSIKQTSNAGTPITEGFIPLLTCDVWEHAYYLDYQNRRPDYVKNFWDIINWDMVASRMQ